MEALFNGQTIERIYLSGKMSGLSDHGFSLLREASSKLRSSGFEVFDPSETDNGDISQPRPYYLRKDIHAIVDWAQAVVVLSNWHSSAGAQLEVHTAKELELPVFDYDRSLAAGKLIEINAENIMEEAGRLITGVRQQDYGHPKYDFARTAKMWTGYLLDKLRDGCEIDIHDVPWMMAHLKSSRNRTRLKRDNYTDAVGYLACGEMIVRDQHSGRWPY